MPEYDYQCEKCETVFVTEHPMSFSGKVKCPACGSTKTTKVFHPAGVVFKGSGFYVTDSSNSRRAASGPATTNGNGAGANGNGCPATDKDSCEATKAKGKCPKKVAGKTK
ncbi:zinc ribbon domain-containing protein [bacterium]|nr:zinc ribbon domain-containing protein [bacterium]